MKQICILLLLMLFSVLGIQTGYAAQTAPESVVEVSAVESAAMRPVAEGVMRTEEIKQAARAADAPNDHGMIQFVALVLLAVGTFLGSVLLLLHYRRIQKEDRQ